MNKKGFSILTIPIIVGALALAFVFYIYANKSISNLFSDEVACTTEARICPDGSAVGRTEPNCEFAACPTDASSTSFDAKFEVYTKGTKRVFSAAMYRHQSEDAFIGDDDPSTVHIQSAGITWQEFFDTLPFSLDSECLTTGTGQTFCSGKEGQLKFYLNGQDSPNALTLLIEEHDLLVVKYE